MLLAAVSLNLSSTLPLQTIESGELLACSRQCVVCIVLFNSIGLVLIAGFSAAILLVH